MRKLFKWGKPYIPHLIILIIMLFVLQFLYSYLPLFISFALEHLGGYQANTHLPAFIENFLVSFEKPLTIILATGISMIILQAIRSLMRFTTNYMSGRITQNIARDMKIKLYNHITDLPFSYHNNVDTGDLIQRSTSDVDTASNFIASQFPTLLDIIGTVLIGAFRVYSISVTLMLVSIVIVPITAIASILYFLNISKLLDAQEKKEAALTTIIQENVNGARVVRAFANEKYEFDKMEVANKDYYNAQSRFNRVMAGFWGSLDALVMLQYTATIVVGIILAREGKLFASDIVAAILLMNMLVWPMRSLGRIVANFGKSVVAARRIGEVLDIPTEYEVNGTLKPVIKGNIDFKNVSFSFPDEDKHFLDKVSFSIKAGETVAIIGKTGSGKSTICNLLTRLLEYQDGDILVDGVSLKEIEKKYLRQNIKMVLQEPFLYSKTVYDNISITDNTLSETAVMQATKLANIHDEIQNFNKGYETIVGEKGTTLSGGQKQRLAIARVLISDSPVLIFDDSLSALDTKTDLMIRQALKMRNHDQTMVIITHRTTTAMEADKIIVLANGSVEAVGTHEELKDKPGLYHDLWEIQGQLQQEFMDVLQKGEETNV